MLRNRKQKAILRFPNNKLVCDRIASPKYRDNNIVICLSKVGVCGTDLQILLGLREDPALILGHEGIGHVIHVGKLIEGFDIGDKVTFNPTASEQTGRILGHTINGLFQQYIAINQKDISNGLVVKVSEEFCDTLGALVEPLATVLYSYELITKLIDVKRILIYGGGQIGMLYALYLRLVHPLVQFYIIHNREERLKWAVCNNIIREEEAVLIGGDKNTIPIDEVEASVICTPRGVSLDMLESAALNTRTQGCIDLFGGFEPEVKSSAFPFCNVAEVRNRNICGKYLTGHATLSESSTGKHIWLTGHRGASEEHINNSVQLLKNHIPAFRKIISHITSIDNAVDILNDYIAKPRRSINGSEWLKMVIEMREPI